MYNIQKITNPFSFLLAQLHMTYLSRCLSAGEIIDALDSLSSNVDQAYDQVMERINQQDRHRRKLAKKILGWVAFGFDISLEELRYALAIEPGRHELGDYLYSEDTLTAVCAGLIRIGPSTEFKRYYWRLGLYWGMTNGLVIEGCEVLEFFPFKVFRDSLLALLASRQVTLIRMILLTLSWSICSTFTL
jgi:hypothetical protein